MRSNLAHGGDFGERPDDLGVGVAVSVADRFFAFFTRCGRGRVAVSYYCTACRGALRFDT